MRFAPLTQLLLTRYTQSVHFVAEAPQPPRTVLSLSKVMNFLPFRLTSRCGLRPERLQALLCVLDDALVPAVAADLG